MRRPHPLWSFFIGEAEARNPCVECVPTGRDAPAEVALPLGESPRLVCFLAWFPCSDAKMGKNAPSQHLGEVCSETETLPQEGNASSSPCLTTTVVVVPSITHEGRNECP